MQALGREAAWPGGQQVACCPSAFWSEDSWFLTLPSGPSPAHPQHAFRGGVPQHPAWSRPLGIIFSPREHAVRWLVGCSAVEPRVARGCVWGLHGACAQPTGVWGSPGLTQGVLHKLVRWGETKGLSFPGCVYQVQPLTPTPSGGLFLAKPKGGPPRARIPSPPRSRRHCPISVLLSRGWELSTHSEHQGQYF